MNIKRTFVRASLVIVAIIVIVSAMRMMTAAALAQTPPPKPAVASQTTAEPAPERKEVPVFSYDPGGRRDPFKDLLGGKEVKGKRVITGLADLEIAEVTLLGIVESRNAFEAIVALPEGFPLTIREGDKLADGFILSIRADAVVFRKTQDNGIPLSRPRDIVKEIEPEERTHD